MVLLFPEGAGNVSLRPETAARLSRLGVTTVAVVGDDEMVGVVLEGWAFDPGTCAAEAAAIVGGERSPRVLHPLLQMAVSPRVQERR